MNFNEVGAKHYRRFDLSRLWVNKQANADSCQAQPLQYRQEAVFQAGRIESAFGSQLLAAFRDQANLVRPQFHRDFQHFRNRRHFLVQMNLNRLMNTEEIGILDMLAIFAQMDRHCIGSGPLSRQGSFYRVGVSRKARLSEGCDMIDINPKFDHRPDSGVSSPCFPLQRIRPHWFRHGL